ncbi:MAG: BBP7 family outer membrane beta-barrel protein [Planctomycetia bacterium]
MAAFVVCVVVAASRQEAALADELIPLPPVDSSPVDLPPVDEILQLPEVDWGLPADSQTYVIAEAVAFQRDNQSADVPLVNDILADDTVLSVGGLNAPTAYGVRAFIGVRRPDALGYEVGYLGVYGMGITRTLTGPASLQIAGPLAGLVPLPFGDGDRVEATYSSMFQSAEFNLFKGCCSDDDRGCIDWLGGFRYANLNEQADLAFTCCTTAPTGAIGSSYNVQTSNNLFGGQFGGRASRWWGNWGLEGWAKTGVFANVQNQSQAPIVDPANPGPPFREARSVNGVEPAMLADLNLSVAYRISERIYLRVGYNALWVGNVALAPEQWDFNGGPESGTVLSGIRGTASMQRPAAPTALDTRRQKQPAPCPICSSLAPARPEVCLARPNSPHKPNAFPPPEGPACPFGKAYFPAGFASSRTIDAELMQ